jgi:hypothetical protein
MSLSTFPPTGEAARRRARILGAATPKLLRDIAQGLEEETTRIYRYVNAERLRMLADRLDAQEDLVPDLRLQLRNARDAGDALARLLEQERAVWQVERAQMRYRIEALEAELEAPIEPALFVAVDPEA